MMSEIKYEHWGLIGPVLNQRTLFAIKEYWVRKIKNTLKYLPILGILLSNSNDE